MSKKKEELEKRQEFESQIRRIRLPRNNECFGVVEQRLGGSRARVRCLDGKTRICSIPGSLKKKLWIREGDIIIVEPWEFGGDEKGNIIFKYTTTQVGWLKDKGYLSKLSEFEEF
jgi:translation initiation factor 1A